MQIIAPTQIIASAPVGLGMALPKQTPPSDQCVTAPRLWKLELFFGSNAESLRKGSGVIDLNIGWYAHLSISTSNIVGLMQEELHLSQDNVQVQDNHLTYSYSEKGRCWHVQRHYTLAGPQWSAKLLVWTFKLSVAVGFRIEHLSVDKVYLAHCSDTTKSKNLVYFFELRTPENNMNIILDETPMAGLWPWPKQEQDVEGKNHNEDDTRKEGIESVVTDLL
ncbi:hypothetical protein F53441_6568 [Fusarium austroafricanum]|uniref:Uncharacterized protein n=1 Tax=Fusarium austroafricanum TaxID=2364996 RepID=A0A8H4NWF1_9HYPO|nr:hypothetical protein F53441_6568 [Fusarium austroafricanum]